MMITEEGPKRGSRSKWAMFYFFYFYFFFPIATKLQLIYNLLHSCIYRNYGVFFSSQGLGAIKLSP